MCILFYLLFPRFCIISKQGPMHPLFSFGTCIWFDNFILEKLLLFIVFRNSAAAPQLWLACIFHFLHLQGCISTQNLISWKILQSPHTTTLLTLGNSFQNSHVIIGSFYFQSLIVSCFPNLLFFPRKIFIILQGAYFIDARMDTIIRFIS